MEEGEKKAEQIIKIAEDEGFISEKAIELIERVHDKIKWMAFGKTNPRTKTAQAKEISDKTSDEEKAKALRSAKSERMKAEIIKIKAMKHRGKSKVFFLNERSYIRIQKVNS